MASDSRAYLSQLHELLDLHFNEEELRSLCLEGLGRNGRLSELVALAQQQRPHIEWPPVPDDFELPESLETAVSSDQYHIYGDNVQGDKFTGDKIGRDKNVVGNVSGQSAVAVGERAQATINQYGDIIIRADNFEDLPPAPGEPPYKGLAYFATKDKDIFFGREKLSDELADKLQTTHFLAIMGASGSGKSSLLRAGIIPRLGERNWRIHIIKPGVHPLAALAASLTRDELDPAATGIIGEALATNADTLHKTAAILVARAHAERLLLAVDQFEELFTQCRDPQEQQAFVDNLVSAAGAQGAVTVLLSMRADFYGRVSQFPNLPDLISQQQVYIKPMAEEDLVRAIAEPAKRGGWQFVEGLVEQFVADVGNEPGRLPLLSHALLATWERRRGVVMTLGGYREAGGVKSAIAQTAEATYADLTASEQLIAKRIFLRLTELGKGTEDTRRRVNQVELGQDTAVQAVTQRLTAARLITTTQDGIDVAHEALIREWPRLHHWLDEDRSGLLIHHRLMDAEKTWREKGEDPSYLYTGLRLTEAKQWAETNDDELNDLERVFLKTSLEAEAQRQRTRRLIQLGLVAVFVIIIMLLVGAALISKERNDAIGARETAVAAQSTSDVNAALAVTRAEEAVDARSTADVNAQNASVAEETSDARKEEAVAAQATADFNADLASTREAEARAAEEALSMLKDSIQASQLSEAALARVDTDPELALKLALTAFGISDQADTRRSVFIAGTIPYRANLEGELWMGKKPSFSPDGSLIAAIIGDGKKVRLWDSVSGNTRVTIEASQQASLQWAKFSPDSRSVLTVDLVGTIKLWNASDGMPKATLYEGQSVVKAATFDSSGDYIIFVTEDGTVYAENIAAEELVPIINESAGEITSAAISLDKEKVLITTPELAQIWTINTGNHIDLVLGNEYTSHWGEFSSNGMKIATISTSIGGEQSVRIWEVGNGELIAALEGHEEGGTYSFAFSPDGTKIVTVGANNKVIRLWDTTDGSLLSSFEGQQWISDVAFSPDGLKIVTVSPDETAIIWDINRQTSLLVLSGLQGFGLSAVFSPDGTKIVTDSYDDTIAQQIAQLWNVDYKPFATLAGPANSTRVASLSPDGRIAITTDTEGVAYLWHTNNGELIYTLTDQNQGVVFSSDFSPSGEYVVTVSRGKTRGLRGEVSSNIDGVARIWATGSGKLITTLHIPSHSVTAAVFSPDGKHVVTITSENVVRVWDMEGNPQVILAEHADEVYRVVFSPDGELIATLNKTGVDLWDKEGKHLNTLNFGPGILQPVDLVEFSPNGKQIVVATTINGIRVWDVSTGLPSATLRGHNTEITTAIFSEDGMQVLTASLDGYVKISDVNSGKLLATFEGNHGGILAATFSQDGFVITLDVDGAVETWRWYTVERLVQDIYLRIPDGFSEQECSQFFRESQQECPLTKDKLFSPLADYLVSPN